jgi:exonuclease SbcD
MKLFHVADIHLGRRRLEGRLPESDFADAFGFIAAQAIEEKADAFLIAGDLFDRAQVEPPHLRQAQEVLAKLKQARIPVVAIEGNHDRASIHSDEPTWLQYLAEDELLFLLRSRFDRNGPILTPWENVQKGGAWIDLGGLRFVGAGYLGAAAPYRVRQIADRLEAGRTHVMLLHAGPDYFGPEGGFSKEDLEAVRRKVCYLALGHIHKPMLHAGWACNPGSPENGDFKESKYGGAGGSVGGRGYAVVEIDPQNQKAPPRISIRSNPRRPCQLLKLDCTPFEDTSEFTDLVDAAVELIRQGNAGPAAIVQLELHGRADLRSITSQQEQMCKAIGMGSGVFLVTLDLANLNLEGLPGEFERLPDGMSREELEKRAIFEVIERTLPAALRESGEEVAELFYSLKEAVRAGRTGEELAEQISRSPVIDAMQSVS